MKKLVLILVFLFMSTYIYAADVIISLKIPSDKAATALEGFLEMYPNDEVNEDGSAKYTNKEWVTEVIRRMVVNDIHRGLVKKQRKEKIIQDDDSIIGKQ